MDNKEQKQTYKINRRGFLKVGAAATAMGVMGALKASTKVANAANETLNYVPGEKGQWSKLHPNPDYSGAAVRYVEHNDEWLGTTRIVGKIKNVSEADMGFNLAARGLLGEEAQKEVLRFVSKYPLSAALSKVLSAIAPDSAVEGKPAEKKLPIPDPEQMSKHIKDVAYFLRADEVGIGKMPPYAYYSHRATVGRDLMASLPVESWTVPVEERLPYVIVVMVDQHLETTLASTGYDGISSAQSFRGYHATGNIATILAQYIRNLGYNARAHHARNYAAVMPPVIIAAGLGELSRTGDSTIHPRLGFRHKVAAVTTDLPLVPDKPIDFGLQDFCRVCRKCAENCPAGAISFDDDYVEYNGYLRWNSDFRKCAVFRTTNKEGSSCGRCMKVCPWNSKEDSWFHLAGTWIGSRGEMSSQLLKSIDDMFGYGTETIEKYKWWLEWPELY
ncbi:MAG TPA: reductive dehalogenase [Peptococcaceae bacterium]|nr:reductive dehalogenase [Peptococcaceae bacterium]